MLVSIPLLAEEIKVKADGSAEDQKSLIDHLNENGKEKNLHFTAADTDYQYRVAIYAESAKGSDYLFGGGADASAVVLSPDCQVVFVITRGGRATKGGAVNALSKEVVKKFAEMKK
jgi:hypothetical protein